MASREKMIVINRAQGGEGGDSRVRAALTVVGDGNGRVGMGKAKGSPGRRAEGGTRRAADDQGQPRCTGTMPSRVGTASMVFMQPAAPGTGVIAGGPMRAVCEVVGVTNVLAKCHGSTNPYNLVRATLNALQNLNSPAEIAAKRGMTVEQLMEA
jgi:small subunit ribosomal protein S5